MTMGKRRLLHAFDPLTGEVNVNNMIVQYTLQACR